MKVIDRTISYKPEDHDALIWELLCCFQEGRQEGLAPGVKEYYFRLAVDEAITNAFQHGNRGRKGDEIRITVEMRKDAISILVRDRGEGFDPAGVPDPRRDDSMFSGHGRGIHMLRQIAEVSWDRASHGLKIELS